MNGFLLPSVGEEATAHRPIKRERQVTGQCSHGTINELGPSVVPRKLGPSEPAAGSRKALRAAAVTFVSMKLNIESTKISTQLLYGN